MYPFLSSLGDVLNTFEHMQKLIYMLCTKQISKMTSTRPSDGANTCHGCDITARYLPQSPINFPNGPNRRKGLQHLRSLLCCVGSVVLVYDGWMLGEEF